MSEELIYNYLIYFVSRKIKQKKLDLQDMAGFNLGYLSTEELQKAVQGLMDLYKAEKEKNKEIEDEIKKAIKEIERRKNLANECIEQEIVIADSDSLNYGRAQAHDVDSVLLMHVVAVADANKIKEILE